MHGIYPAWKHTQLQGRARPGQADRPPVSCTPACATQSAAQPSSSSCAQAEVQHWERERMQLQGQSEAWAARRAASGGHLDAEMLRLDACLEEDRQSAQVSGVVCCSRLSRAKPDGLPCLPGADSLLPPTTTDTQLEHQQGKAPAERLYACRSWPSSWRRRRRSRQQRSSRTRAAGRLRAEYRGPGAGSRRGVQRQLPRPSQRLRQPRPRRRARRLLLARRMVLLVERRL